MTPAKVIRTGFDGDVPVIVDPNADVPSPVAAVVASEIICDHCGEPLVIDAEMTHYYDAWSEYELTIEFDDNGTPYVTEHGHDNGEGETGEIEYEFVRTCCGIPIDEELVSHWKLRALFDRTDFLTPNENEVCAT